MPVIVVVNVPCSVPYVPVTVVVAASVPCSVVSLSCMRDCLFGVWYLCSSLGLKLPDLGVYVYVPLEALTVSRVPRAFV